jgi:hypothetical protein
MIIIWILIKLTQILSIMSIDFFLNDKPVKAKPNESFGDVFDNNCQGKF